MILPTQFTPADAGRAKPTREPASRAWQRYWSKVYGRFWKIISALLLLLATAGLAVPIPATTQAAAPTPKMQPNMPVALCVIQSPNAGSISVLNAMSATPPKLGAISKSLWSVGYSEDSLIGPARTLTMRHDDNGWTIVPSPNLPGNNYLTAVSVRAEDDAWAVGYAANADKERPLIMHYDGKVWSLIMSPTVIASLPDATHLTGVFAPSNPEVQLATVVIVGYVPGHLGADRPVAVSYDGTGWTSLNEGLAPNGRLNGITGGVTGTSLTDLWAVSTIGQEEQADRVGVLYHFDGKAWNTIFETAGSLISVASVGSRVFAVGNVDAGKASTKETLAIMYEASFGKFLRVDTPSPNPVSNYLTSVVANGSVVYAVGYGGDESVGMNTLVRVYEDAVFQTIGSPNPSGVDRLMGAALDTDGNLWTVGSSQIWLGSRGIGGTRTLVISSMCGMQQ